MKHSAKTAAVCMSALLAAQAMPAPAGVGAADGDILVTGFEDGDVSAFAPRGDEDTSVIGTTETDPHSGTACMAVTGRSQGWNGPSLSLSGRCEPGVQYVASAWVKTAWYNNCMLSMQYTDADGEQHYGNLASVISQGEWVEIPPTKFSFSDDMLDVQIYIESSDKVDLYVDDFSLTTAPVFEIEQDKPPLKDVYNDYFKIGCATTAGELAPTSTKNLILRHFNSVTLGNELKPENMLDQKATIAYMEETGDNATPIVKLNGSAKVILNFCRDNNIPVRGHVLVWHSQTPGWFFKDNYTLEGDWVDKATMLKRMEAYIKGVFEVLDAEYPDVDFYAWDVVNEAWLDDGKPRRGGTYDEDSSASGWTQIWGDNSFIEPAFEFARKYAPKGTKLYYNDYNEYMTQKMDAICEMAEGLKAKGLIDGIGMQSHLDVRSGADAFPSVQQYENAVKRYSQLGLDIQITELDATVSGNSSASFKAQADYYSGILDAAVKYKDSISAVVFWGTTDDQSWRASQYPLLFNEDYTAKPCFDSIVDGITYTTAPATATTTKTTTTTTQTTTTATQTQTTTMSQPTTITGTTGMGDSKRLSGDVNCDGEQNVKDAVFLAKLIAEDKEAAAQVTEQGRDNADVNLDGAISDTDLSVLLRHLAGKVNL